MRDNNSVFYESSDYNLCYTCTDLDDEGYFCTENVHVEKEFFGDSKHYDSLSANSLKLSDWKEKNSHVSVGFNHGTKELHDQLRKELIHVTNKIKIVCGSEILAFEDLVDIKYGSDSEIMKAFTSSGINAFKNNYEKCIQFLGTFLFCC